MLLMFYSTVAWLRFPPIPFTDCGFTFKGNMWRVVRRQGRSNSRAIAILIGDYDVEARRGFQSKALVWHSSSGQTAYAGVNKLPPA
jgi:hypothetical protein